MVKVKCYHFGMCMSCRCLQEPKATGGGDDFVMDSELYQSVRNVETLYQRNNQEGKTSKFLTDQMQDAHMIQNANAWAAMKQWLIMKNTEVRGELVVGVTTDFYNLQEDMNSSALPHRTEWDTPSPLRLPELYEWIGQLPFSRVIRSKSNYLRSNHMYSCCRECNLLMDVKGRIWHLLWNITSQEDTLNTNDDAEEALIPARSIEITHGDDGDHFKIPCSNPRLPQGWDREKLFTSVSSYYVHRCLMGLVAGKADGGGMPLDQLDLVHVRICAMVGVVVLKLLCFKKESNRRWSPKDAENRSPHTYTGVIMLYISYVMYMMYLCDNGEDLSKIGFDSFHYFYMGELLYSPLWNPTPFSDIWSFVLREAELDDSRTSTAEQLRYISRNLVDLYKNHVVKLLAVIHPFPSVYAMRLSPVDLALVGDRIPKFFVTPSEVTDLCKLHDQANKKGKAALFALYIKSIGFAPIGLSIRRMFISDGTYQQEILKKWNTQFIVEEYKRMKSHNGLRSMDAAKCLYLMCNVMQEDLESNDIVDSGQDFLEVLQTPDSVSDCLRKLEALAKISVWKAVLNLRNYGRDSDTGEKKREIKLPAAEQRGFFKGMDSMCTFFTDSHLTVFLSMKTGQQVSIDRVSGVSGGSDGTGKLA